MFCRRSVFTKDDPRVFREGDIPSLLLDPDIERGFGLAGSDSIAEISPRLRAQLRIEDLGRSISNLRFALMALVPNTETVRKKIDAGDPIIIGTSNPATVGAIALNTAIDFQVSAVYGGQIEKLPRLLPRLDGIIDLVDSGKSCRDQGLEVVLDDLQTVTLCGLWALEGSQYY